jgi:hypothetical protein
MFITNDENKDMPVINNVQITGPLHSHFSLSEAISVQGLKLK